MDDYRAILADYRPPFPLSTPLVPVFYPAIPVFYPPPPVIPAKAGIQRVADSPGMTVGAQCRRALGHVDIKPNGRLSRLHFLSPPPFAPSRLRAIASNFVRQRDMPSRPPPPSAKISAESPARVRWARRRRLGRRHLSRTPRRSCSRTRRTRGTPPPRPSRAGARLCRRG